MFNVNDCVMYGRNGACRISDITDGSFIGKPDVKYYILHPIYSNDCAIMTPVDCQKVMIRQLASKQEVYKLIDSMPSQEAVWIDDDKQRNNEFTQKLNSGLCTDWIKLIKSIYQKNEEKKELGKKLPQADQNIWKDAKKLLYEEFSASLEMPPEKIESFIAERINSQMNG
jgi:CarD family transcriptional regulator